MKLLKSLKIDGSTKMRNVPERMQYSNGWKNLMYQIVSDNNITGNKQKKSRKNGNAKLMNKPSNRKHNTEPGGKGNP